MHMADALLSAPVALGMCGVSAAMIGYSVHRLRSSGEPPFQEQAALAGVMGAFVFAAQMINFAIPGTGSSGHIGGAILLAALLGPWTGFLVLAAVLAVQALFFADGGLLALGCNLFNMGFFGCFLCYPAIFRPLKKYGDWGIFAGTVLATVVALQLGAFAVVLETLCSGITELPFAPFVLLMQPIHLAIGAVEGVLTGALLVMLRRARPALLDSTPGPAFGWRRTAGALLIAALLIGGGLSYFASEHPDGLEWSMEKVAGTAELEHSGALHRQAAALRNHTAVLPDYPGPGYSGIIGALLTLSAVIGVTALIRRCRVAERS